ncbi:MAG: type II secretion system F family protein [Lachnospiraceae bacterium]|nr:type II secretion system F family protein [Lachnospiraceae bacterium]
MYALMILSVLIATAMTVVWIVFWRKAGDQYDELLSMADSKIFAWKDLYSIGLCIIEAYETKTKRKLTETKGSADKIKELAEVFGRDNAELYFYIYRSAQVSLILTFVPIGLFTGCAFASLMGFLIGGAVAFAIIYGLQSSVNTAMMQKKAAILSEFPQMVSKLTLLVNAGMLVRKAWDLVANSNTEKDLYREMRATSTDIREGMSIEQAMESFADRCGIKEMRKFSSIYVQAVNRSAAEAVHSMKAMATEAWEQKKEIAKQQGEIASQKLLIPNLIMFLGILIIVVVPMVVSMMGSL